MHLHILIAAITFELGASRFLDFLQIVAVLFGLVLIIHGIWRISRNELSEAMAPIAGGFLLCLSVVIVRMFAGWVGVSL
jgi:hypothetical protein